MLIKKNIIQWGGAIILFLMQCSIVHASPWAAVGDSQLRNDVEILARNGVISGPVNTWPISWKQITRNLSRTSDLILPPYVRLAVMRVKEKVPDQFRATVRMTVTNNQAIVRGFETTARNDLDAEIIAEYNNSDSGTTVHIQGGYRKGNGVDYVHLDGSYLSQDVGNWSVYVGAFDRWWGPGRESTLILSNNARPMPSVGFRRIEPKAFETKWLSWIGPWQWDMFIAKMEKERFIPKPVFIGMRVTFEPIKNFEVGLTRTLQLCGEGRPCGISQWTNALISIGDLDNPQDAAGISQEPGNQLASIDFAYSLSVSDNVTLKLFAEGTAEDLLVILPFEYGKLFGFSLSGPYGFWGGNWRITSELSDTLTNLIWFGGRRRPNVMYEHHIYQTGYRYKSRSLGHSLDNDTKLISLIAQYQDSKNWEYIFKYHHAEINTDGRGKHTLSLVRKNINIFEVSVKGDIGFSHFNLGIRHATDGVVSLGQNGPFTSFNIALTTNF